ncbi:MAG TPA: M12 family metallo-peptidase [Phycisphaerales bacterium]|nr:M12 family metallo-peptidase [Phycisphaerales bacterium]
MKTNPFQVAAAAAGLVCLAGVVGAQPTLPSPLVSGPGDEAVREVRLDAAQLGMLRRQSGPFVLAGFPLPHGGSADLVLEPFDVLTPDAQVVLGAEGGDVEIGRPDVALFRGSVAGDPDSRVFLSFSALGPNGLIQRAGSTVVLSSGELGGGGPTVIADIADFPRAPEFARAWECGVGAEHVNPLGLDLDAIGVGTGAGPRSNPCRIARIAIDTDFEYTSWLFGGNLDASAAYAVTLLGAVSEIYARELNVRLVVPFVRVWDADVDPYGGDRLGELQAHWHANMGHVQRELAHLLSGNYGGGVAWVSVLCSKTYGYGLSGVGGSFPYPLRDHDHGNWDLFVVAHELGHNFGTLHTHDGYNPPIDGCGLGDCSQAWGGTIMSYCHGCAGGMSNIVLEFGPRVIEQISGYLDSACDILGESRAFAYDDEAVALEDATSTIDALANDQPLNCSALEIFAVQTTTDQGGAAAVSKGTGEGGRDEVLYTPAPGFTGADAFFYIARTDAGVATTAYVSVQVIAVRPADGIGISRPGTTVDYYDLPNSDRLPDFDGLAPFARDHVPEINFSSTHDYFATSRRYNNVGAVFQGLIDVPETGYYTLFIESDDGSRLLVGEDVLIDHDGLHGMTERSGGIGLAAGWHRLRVEFFDNTGAQGLIVRVEGPGLPKQVVPAPMWRTDSCIADWTPDGAINTIDVIAFLAAWNLRDPSADLDANGRVNTADIVQFLNAWAAGCE